MIFWEKNFQSAYKKIIMLKKIIIIGSGYHSKVVLYEILQLKKYKVIGFIDEKIKRGTVVEKIGKKSFKILSNIDGIKDLTDKNTYGVIGIGTNFVRKKIANIIEKKNKNFKWASIISKKSILSGKISIGKGTVIISNTVINTGTVIGDHCLINTSSSIDHDNVLKNYSSTGPGVVTGGNVHVGECSHLGIASTIRQKISIGNNTIIGAKSLILKNCKKDSIYYGMPAKKIRNRKFNELYL
jgi:sugar O-acyltransferase (sialic acid O-acetyltransferase NeuD family)